VDVFGSGTLEVSQLWAGVFATVPLLGMGWAGDALALVDGSKPSLKTVLEARKGERVNDRETETLLELTFALIVLGCEPAPLLASASGFLVAASAGIGEELLFRGVIQQELASFAGDAGGLILASIAFGLGHSFTLSYALQAGITGMYFGFLYIACGHTVLAPAVAHLLYDWVALMVMHFQATGEGPGTQVALVEQLSAALNERGATLRSFARGESTSDKK